MMNINCFRWNASSPYLALLLIFTIEQILVSGFQTKNSAFRFFLAEPFTTTCKLSKDHISDFERPATFLDEEEDNGVNIVFIDEDDDKLDAKRKGRGRSRWENLKPSVKKRIIEQGQAKAIANKKKREPASEKKRRESKIYYGFIAVVVWYKRNSSYLFDFVVHDH